MRYWELLQALLNSNSHGDGSTDHGVVAHAQEAHRKQASVGDFALKS